ncbi:L,D-transpeptidase [Motilibacter aurantiacus]|uniref:L,D-transpeptidase n=1 Tax=Motilibacter aurantiacus TaxID=2714955 RepID=UPI001408A6D2|nr:L,D-transpeptidase family protein [Motilibacter aurantiacus]
MSCTSTGVPRARRVLQLVATVSALALVPALASCDSGNSEAIAAVSGSTPSASASASAAQIVVSPTGGARGVGLDSDVVLTVTGGALRGVVVTDADGDRVPGALAADGKTWEPEEPLEPATRYTVRTTARDTEGRVAARTTRFTTVRPSEVLDTAISPLTGSTVGVGMPIVVRLNADVPDAQKAAVEKGLTVTSSKSAPGAWSWMSDREVHYRPKVFWPSNTKVTLAVALNGIAAEDGAWGTSESDREIKFSVGASMISTVDVSKHRMVVRRNGKVWATIPVTTGKGGFLTRGGTKVISEKYEMKVMDAATTGISQGDPEYYRLDVPFAMRVTNSGEFVHAAPWSTGSQGSANVSHGCVGMSMSDAKRLFDNSLVGDVVKVVGSSRELEPGNGWTDWNVSWKDWLEGSALA